MNKNCWHLIFMSRINFMLSGVEHEKSFITSGPDLGQNCLQRLAADNTCRQRVNQKLFHYSIRLHTLKLRWSITCI